MDELEGRVGLIVKEGYLAKLRELGLGRRLDRYAEILGDDYLELFGRTFGPKGDGSQAPEWLRLIFDLPINWLFTTNYTAELEQVARFHPAEPLGSRPRSVRWYEAEEMAEAFRGMPVGQAEEAG